MIHRTITVRAVRKEISRNQKAEYLLVIVTWWFLFLPVFVYRSIADGKVKVVS